MKPLTAREVEAILAAHGYRLRRTRGSHAIWYNARTRHAVPVPHHGSSTIPEGTLQSIFNGAHPEAPEVGARNSAPDPGAD